MRVRMQNKTLESSQVKSKAFQKGSKSSMMQKNMQKGPSKLSSASSPSSVKNSKTKRAPVSAGKTSFQKAEKIRIDLEIPSELSAKEAEILKKDLLFRKTNILNKSQELAKEALITQTDGVQDEADVASHSLTVNLSLNLHERDLNALLAIDRALNKLEIGSFGRCEICSECIGFKRLQARPFASLCIDCMHDQELTRLQ